MTGEVFVVFVVLEGSVWWFVEVGDIGVWYLGDFGVELGVGIGVYVWRVFGLLLVVLCLVVGEFVGLRPQTSLCGVFAYAFAHTELCAVVLVVVVVCVAVVLHTFMGEGRSSSIGVGF